MTRTIESPFGLMRVLPIMAHVPPNGGSGEVEAGTEERESSPAVEIVSDEPEPPRACASAAA